MFRQKARRRDRPGGGVRGRQECRRGRERNDCYSFATGVVAHQGMYYYYYFYDINTTVDLLKINTSIIQLYHENNIDRIIYQYMIFYCCTTTVCTIIFILYNTTVWLSVYPPCEFCVTYYYCTVVLLGRWYFFFKSRTTLLRGSLSGGGAARDERSRCSFVSKERTRIFFFLAERGAGAGLTVDFSCRFFRSSTSHLS